jgi:hypothetical protein
MRWEIPPKLRFDIVAFAGLNLSGERRVIEVHALGGRQGDLQPEDLKSVAIIGPVGLRVVFKTSDDPEEWVKQPWRCVRLIAGHTFDTKEGRPCVRIPDLDLLNTFDARRTDPDFEEGFEEAASLADSTAWTFGRSGKVSLKTHIRAISVDILP